MKERPILFSGPMVRALLDGSKTQTRRIAKLPHNNPLGTWEPTTFGGPDGGRTAGGETLPLQGGIWHTRTGDSLMCPHGQPGDRLWVRETFCLESNSMTDDDGGPPHNDGRPVKRFGDEDCYWSQPHYKASDPEPELWYEDMDGPGCRWTPSIHMPRWVSRITLEVTGVRVERLQDISVADAIAEGIEVEPRPGEPRGMLHGHPVPLYQWLWNTLNADRGYGWDINPWVWVVEFKRSAL